MTRDDDIFDGIGIEVALPHPDQARVDFLKVRETLTRIGKADDQQTLTQQCYILHKRGRYVIAHLRELQWLDGSPVEPTDDEIAIRNRVAILLENWGLVDILDGDEDLAPLAPMGSLRVISYRDKDKWELVSGYDIGGLERNGRRRNAVDRVGGEW